jgi:hypothetical protein
MAIERDLRLHQEVVLLALKDQKGTPVASTYTFALAGAILTELFLEERVGLEERKRGKPLVTLQSGTQIGDPVLDDALRQVREAKRRANAVTWVQRWAKPRLLHETARRLAQQGVLRVEEKRVLLLFNRTVYPEMDPGPERRLIERMRTAIFGDDEVDASTAAIVTLAHAAALLNPIFGRKELKGRKKRIAALSEGDAVGEATRAAIQAAHAAVVAATAAATSAAT